MIPKHILRATHFTLYWAMVFCRNYTAGKNVNPRIVYEIMDAIHEIPNILDRWGAYDNDIEKLRTYFGCFDSAKWEIPDSPLEAPDLLQLFDRKVKEFENLKSRTNQSTGREKAPFHYAFSCRLLQSLAGS